MSADVPSRDPLAAWNTRSESDRLALVASIVKFVAAKLKDDTFPWYPGSSQNEPYVHIFGAEQRGRRLTLHFVADHLIYCFAQSGSDWADHYIFAGEATFEDDQRVAENLALVKHVSLSEREADDYDQRAAVARVRDAASAEHRGRL